MSLRLVRFNDVSFHAQIFDGTYLGCVAGTDSDRLCGRCVSQGGQGQVGAQDRDPRLGRLVSNLVLTGRRLTEDNKGALG